MNNQRATILATALKLALSRRDITPAVLLHHSDRGSQYAATGCLALLTRHGIQVSMSGTGNPYGNAMMESFLSTLRAELTD